jgi:hypothetical protein
MSWRPGLLLNPGKGDVVPTPTLARTLAIHSREEVNLYSTDII